jgi:hypothetical protein
LPLIPYINIKPEYKTPYGFEPYEKLLYNEWREWKFEDIKSKDIVRRMKYPDIKYKVIRTFPEVDQYHPAGFTVEAI